MYLGSPYSCPLGSFPVLLSLNVMSFGLFYFWELEANNIKLSRFVSTQALHATPDPKGKVGCFMSGFFCAGHRI